MIRDADEVERNARLEVDICIVGSGPAGISLALTLSGQGLSIILLESGRMEAAESTQALYAGEVVDARLHSPPDKYRHRGFGGSTAIWGGRCMPFDPIDFEQREYIPGSGWPISYDEVARHYPAANEWVEAGEFEYSGRRAFKGKLPPLIKGFDNTAVLTDNIERFSCPTHFARRYEKRLQQAGDIDVLLSANCTSIRLSDDGKRVREVEVSTLAGNRFSVAAKTTVLAVGGIETARLLLASRDVASAGIGNKHDVVGRYYMCHIAGTLGLLAVHGGTDRVHHGYGVTDEGIYCRRRMSLSPSEQKRLGLANMTARLHFQRITDPAHRSGVLSGLFLARRFISYEYGKRLNSDDAASFWRSVGHLRNVVTDPLDTLRFLWNWVTKRTLAERKFPSVVLENRTNCFSLDIHCEQIPLRESRITLSDSTDALGVPQICVDWRFCEDDIASVRRTLDVFSAEFRKSGVASFDFDSQKLEEELTLFGAYGGHHIGTARMGSDVQTSVVDSNCKVHDVENLFIAGSAVFPTSSQANPTLTIIALAVRLAEHLKNRFNPVAPGGSNSQAESISSGNVASAGASA